MFLEVFLKIFLAILGKVLIFKVFRVESFFKVFFWKSGAWGLWGILGVFLFGLPFPWLPIRVSIHLRFASDDSPFVFRSFFDCSPFVLRFPNGDRTESERSSNGAWTEPERRSNGGWTEELTLLAKRSVFLRYDIGMPSELSSAKMERVLASLRVQSYNAKKRNPNFLQICGVSKAQNDENTRLTRWRN